VSLTDCVILYHVI